MVPYHFSHFSPFTFILAIPSLELGETGWIICDGDIDPEWVESLNSVLDDNRLLSLPSGERIQFGSGARFLFETHELTRASPATVSRLGVVFVSESAVSPRLLVRAWLSRQARGPTAAAGTSGRRLGAGSSQCRLQQQRDQRADQKGDSRPGRNEQIEESGTPVEGRDKAYIEETIKGEAVKEKKLTIPEKGTDSMRADVEVEV
ncbi:unnamed protein product, partial [Protopolystoma xenopodis]